MSDHDDLQGAFDPDDTASFSVPHAVRAPIGVTLPPTGVSDVRRAAVALAIGIALMVLDVRPFGGGEGGIDVVPDTLGGLFILAGTLRAARVAAVTGPQRAGRIAIALAVLQLPLLLPADGLGLEYVTSQRLVDVATYLQGTIAAFGTAVVATILSRAHDALGQLGRRRRWAQTRRAALVVAVSWLPFGLPGESVTESSPMAATLFFGLTSVLLLLAAVAMMILLVRALGGSINADVRIGWGEA